MLCRLCVRNIFHGNALASFFSVVVSATKARQIQIPYKLIVYLYYLLAVFARPGHFVHIYTVNEFPQQRCGQLKKIPIVVCSQLSRAVNYRSGKRPILQDLRQVRLPDQFFDGIIFIHPNSYYCEDGDPILRDDTELILAIKRSGVTGRAYVKFNVRKINVRGH